MRGTYYYKCSSCACELNDENRAGWTDMCEDCETAVFEFYGAVDSPENREKLARLDSMTEDS
jgi:hypothetical protein|tara:strand:+ start:404 stop:589 length:186 start_codon:yes stop_codon:yes gene_type:complete